MGDLDQVLSLCPPQGGRPPSIGSLTPCPQGTKTEDIANRGETQEVIILPNSRNYSGGKRHSQGMLPRLLALQLKPAPLPLFDFKSSETGEQET